MSSASEEPLQTNYDDDSSPAAQTILDPEYAELFATDADKFEEHDFRVSHMSSVRSFYLQKIPGDTKRIDLVERLLKKYAISGGLIKVESPRIDDFVAAKMQGVWLRVKVIRVCESCPSEVISVDHGNVCFPSEFFALPQKLRDLPALAHRCALQLPKSSVDLNETFEEIISSNSAFKIKVIEEVGDTMVIDLYKDSKSVTELLLAKSSITSNTDQVANETIETSHPSANMVVE